MSKLNFSSKELGFIVIALNEYCLARQHCDNCIFFLEDGEQCKQVSILMKLENPAE